MRALDLLVVNSRVEPFGLVALEAMACGTPVLATGVRRNAEMIGHGKTGWLVPPGDEQALATAIVDLWRRPVSARRPSLEGKKHVAAHFTAGSLPEKKLETFYRSMMWKQEVRSHESCAAKPEATNCLKVAR